MLIIKMFDIKHYDYISNFKSILMFSINTMDKTSLYQSHCWCNKQYTCNYNTASLTFLKISIPKDWIKEYQTEIQIQLTKLHNIPFQVKSQERIQTIWHSVLLFFY